MTVTGTKFTGASAVKFNGTAAAFTVVGDTEISATVPTGATSGTIAVTTAGGTGVSASGFTVTSPAPEPTGPTITSFTPTSGAYRVTVTITGTRLTGATKVKFNTASATFAVVSATQIRAAVPYGAATGPISVVTPLGTAVSATSFVLGAAPPPAVPTLTGFSPTSGPAGTAVTLTGTGLTGASAVRFNGTAAAFTVSDATHIAATVPAGATSGTVSVVTPGGTATSVSSFTVTAPAVPTLTGFSPTSGPVGTVVTLTGTSLTGASAVRFNGTAASFSVSDATHIAATVPAGATSGTVSVVTPGGTATSDAGFTVTAPAVPTLTGFSPTSGPVGTVVTLTGTNLTGASAVRFNGTAAAFTVSDATHIAATVPAGATSGTVSVVTPGGTATSAASFTVTVPVPGAPLVTSFSPTAGKYRSIVYIYGTGFTGATKVKFNTASATFAVVSATQIKAAVPYGATTGPITVVTPRGTSSSLGLFYLL